MIFFLPRGCFLHGQSKILFPKNCIHRTNILRLCNSKAPSKVKRHLLTSYKVNYLTKRPPLDDNGNVALMVEGALQDFILHFAT